MTERQSQMDGVDARTEADHDGDAHGPAGAGHSPAEPTVPAQQAPPAGDTPVGALAGQVADQVAGEHEAVEPAPAEPGSPAPTGDETVLDGAAAVGMAEAAPVRPTPRPRPAAGGPAGQPGGTPTGHAAAPAPEQAATTAAGTPEAAGAPEAAESPGGAGSGTAVPAGSGDATEATGGTETTGAPAATGSTPAGPSAGPVPDAPAAADAPDRTETSAAESAPDHADGGARGAGPAAAPAAGSTPPVASAAETETGGPAVFSLFEPPPRPTDTSAGTPATEADPAAAVDPEATVVTATPAVGAGTPRRDAPERQEPVTDEAPRTERAGAERPAGRTAPPAPPQGSDAPTAMIPVISPPGPDAGTRRPDDSETTQVIPLPAGTAQDSPTEEFSRNAGGAPPPPSGPDAADGSGAEPPKRSRRLLVVAGVLGALLLLYIGDIVFSLGAVPRGVTVAGVSIGGLSDAAAEERLRAEVEPRTTQPVQVTAGEVSTEIDPIAAGLTVDWPATLDRAGSQPLNPITRITSFFTERDVDIATSADPVAVATALEQLAPVVDRVPVEGTVTFEGTEPVPVEPVPGQRLDLPAATEALQRDWVDGRPVALPLVSLPAMTTSQDVAEAIEEVARPAVSAPVTIVGEAGTRGLLDREEIAGALAFRADVERGGLIPEINREAVIDGVSEDLAPSERPGRDAALEFSGGRAVVVPSQDGHGVDYEATLGGLLTVLTGTGPREITAVYAEQPAEVTTEEVEALGINGVIGEFTTGGFAADSGQNIRRAAEQINGSIVEPGETFSLNQATAPRNAANGYVEAGIIEDGAPARGIGGGVSQVATTLYNAAYFAGMTDVAHKAHSFYISRYPAGREATVFEGAIDLRFRNDNPTGVYIETVWTPSSLTIRLYGTKLYEVTSTPGPRTNPTEPNVITIPPGKPCRPSQGAPGFTITDTRTLRNVETGETRTETQTTRYNPSPTVVCGG